MKRTVIAIFGVVLSSAATTPAKAASAVVGINVVHPQSLTVAQENDILDNLKAAGVHVIRTRITPDDKTIDFVKRAYAIGIKVEWITSPKFPPDAPSRPYRPNAHEAVVHSAVIGRIVNGNEEVAAFVQLLPGSSVTAADLMAYAGTRLTSYKRPSEIILMRWLPAISTGTILKRKLVEYLRQAASAS